jgi:hypothetical protein
MAASWKDADMKTYGANIRCSACGAQPWPDNFATRESFNLRRFGPHGYAAETPSPGEWRCELHFPAPGQPSAAKPRVARVASDEALANFERVFADEAARLDEAIADQDGAASALEAFRQEVERALAAARKAVLA